MLVPGRAGYDQARGTTKLDLVRHDLARGTTKIDLARHDLARGTTLCSKHENDLAHGDLVWDTPRANQKSAQNRL